MNIFETIRNLTENTEETAHSESDNAFAASKHALSVGVGSEHLQPKHQDASAAHAKAKVAHTHAATTTKKWRAKAYHEMMAKHHNDMSLFHKNQSPARYS